MVEIEAQEKFRERTKVGEGLAPEKRQSVKTRAEWIRIYKRFLKIEEHRILLHHRAGAGGLEISRQRSELLDEVLRALFTDALKAAPIETGRHEYPITLIASGGYGRGLLNPGSDVDVMFLCPANTSRLPQETVDLIGEIVAMLFDVGFKVGYAARSIKEAIHQANIDNQTKTALIESRLIMGDPELFDEFQARFHKDCIVGKEKQFLTLRMKDLTQRHEKYQHNIYLQEPNVKEGCGGLRDYQNIIWVIYCKYGTSNLEDLVEKKLLTRSAWSALEKGHEFLMRVRNELHYCERPRTDILTLRLQGQVASHLEEYTEKSLLRRIEDFMRDYYRHTRAIYMHSTSLMQAFRLLQKEEDRSGIISFMARRSHKQEHFDGFYSLDGLIYPENKDIFHEEPRRLMRMFQHLQTRHLKLSPQIRKMFKRHYALIDRPFRYHKANRMTFEAILSRKGDVSRTLRSMHRVGFLGKYLPEFGALDCLVQHEFFHQYTADEHTLKCIDMLDSLSDEKDSGTRLFQKLFHELEDPAVLYLALILHDAGRALNEAEHIDGSSLLAMRVCKRLQVKGARRRRLLFLVDNHLLFFRTATGRDLQDPQTIEEFTNIVGSPNNMDTLLLMAWADSKATNDEAWSPWKESLILQLYRNAQAWFSDEKKFQQQLTDARADLKEKVAPKLKKDAAEEVEAHFENMPERYFHFREEASVIRHVRMFRNYIRQFVKEGASLERMKPVFKWVQYPDQGCTHLEVVTLTRSHLLSKIAGSLAANNINILSADIFTRKDSLVLDIFRVCTTDLEPVTSETTQRNVEELITTLLANTLEVRDLACRMPAPSGDKPEGMMETFPVRVLFRDDRMSPWTLVEVQALDRLGLLYDLFLAIARFDIEVVLARVSTEKGAAVDSFFLSDGDGNKVKDQELLESLRQAVDEAARIS